MGHGGKRPNAGRPRGGGKYGEPTTPLRVPESRLDAVKQFLVRGGVQIPLYASKVQAGFPSPADDHIEALLDLNEYLVPHPSATFLVYAQGESMLGAGIRCGDMLIVDRSLTPVHQKIVVVAIDGELTVKRLHCRGGRVVLKAENPAYSPIDITDTDTIIWGVVTNVIHKV